MSAANDDEKPERKRRPRPIVDPLAYGIEAAAEAMGVSRSTVFEWIRQGKVQSRKIGGRTLIPRSELLRLLEPDAA